MAGFVSRRVQGFEVAEQSEIASKVQSVDTALAQWRQGDCVLGEHWFLHRTDGSFAVTEAGKAAVAGNGDIAEQEVAGLVVVTQTCEVVRSCLDRPFVEVCPLVRVSQEHLHEVQRGRRPAYGFVPALAAQQLVADLDRVMTVEKPLVATWQRLAGCRDDTEVRIFSQALARKRIRFAFSDDFTALVRKLQLRLIDKHDKHSIEGRSLRALREIRVHASPTWGDNRIDIFFWFIRHEIDVEFEGESWDTLLQHWLKLVPPSGRFHAVEGQVVTLDDMTATDYVESDPLDLDHLSASRVG